MNEEVEVGACVCVFVYACDVCGQEGVREEEGWIVTPWKSGDNALALNPPSVGREG